MGLISKTTVTGRHVHTAPETIVLSRTDNIGDVVLTLPMAAVLRQAFPQTRIIVLARNYVKDIVEAKPEVDVFLSWDSLESQSESDAVATLKALQITVILHVFPNRAVSSLAKKAGIPLRIGSLRKVYHWLTCNRFVAFSRSRSSLHEAQLNLKMLKSLDLRCDYTREEIIPLSAITMPGPVPDEVGALLDAERFSVVLHPLSNGNGREWPLRYFKALIDSLPAETFQVIVTGTAAEYERIRAAGLLTSKVTNVVDRLSLRSFIYLLSEVDGVVINSTGPLHIAAALGTHALGLFPPDPSAGPHRWACIGKRAEVMTTDQLPAGTTYCRRACTNLDCACMRQITVSRVQAVLEHWAADNATTECSYAGDSNHA